MGKVSYTITAKDKTRSGASSARKNITDLGGAAKAAGRMMKLAFAGFSLRAISAQVGKANEAFKVQSDVNAKLAQVLKATGSAIPYDQMKKMASAMSSMTGIPDEVINQSQAVMATFKAIGKETFPRAMKAASDMSAVLGGDLQGATIQLSKALNDFDGFTALKRAGVSFSEEQERMIKKFKETNDLAAYQELILKELEGEFGGVAEAMGKTDVGALKVAAATIGDIYEQVGEVFTKLKADTARKLQPVLEGITKWFSEHSAQIVTFFQELPRLASAAFSFIKSAASKMFTVEFWQTFGTITWEFFKDAGKVALSFIWEAVKAIGTTLWEPLKFGFLSIGHGIRSAFTAIVNFFIEKLNWLGEKAHDIGQKIAHPLNAANRTKFDNPIAPLAGPGGGPQNNIKESIAEAWQGVLDSFKDGLFDSAELLKETFSKVMASGGDVFGDEFKTFIQEFQKIIGEPVKLEIDAGDGSSGSPESAPAAPAESAFGSFFTSMMESAQGMFTQIMESVKTAFDDVSGSLGSFGGGLWSVISAFGSAFMQIQSFAALMKPLNVVMDGIMKILTPIINDLLAPLVGFLYLLGQLIGKTIVPILKLLSPILEVVSKAFLVLYNYAIRPFANFVIWIIATINNFIATVVNALLGWLGVHMDKMSYEDMKLEKISMEDLNTAGAEYSGYDLGGGGGGGGSSGSSSSGASYAAKGDIYITVDYQVGISAFDDRDIALKIRDEIERAEAMGF